MGGGVVQHRPVDQVGEPSLEAAHRFHGGLPVGLLAVVVVAADPGVAQLDGGHDVQDPVDLPVARPGQPVSGLVAGRGVDGCGAIP